MTELMLLLAAVLLVVITATGPYKKRLKNVPFLIVARLLIIGLIIYYCIINDHIQGYHLIVAGMVIVWLCYDTTLRILHHKNAA